MKMKNTGFSKAYLTQPSETSLDNLVVIGDVPKWLSGSFVSNGPAQFEVNTTHFNLWCDVFAMLKKFNFESGKVSFQNRFLRSQQYAISNTSGRLNSNEFATYANTSLLGRLRRSIKGLMDGNIYDNCNINTTCIADHFIAMTETSDIIEFKLNDLSTIGPFQFADNVQGQLASAHPHLDIATGEIINIAIEVGRIIKYHIYKIVPHSIKREIIQTYISKKLFYMHSFSITSNYVILFKSPLVINKFKLLLGLPFNDTLSWLRNNPSSFIIIDRNDGSTREIETDPFVCLHNVNAYENGNEVILDLICHGDGNPYNYLYLSNLQSPQPNLPSGTLRRYVIDINSKRCGFTTLSSYNQEFPRINYKAINGKDYQFIYTNLITNAGQRFFNAIQKFNVRTGKIQCYEKMNYYIGEPVFVARPHGQFEDDGMLLSIAFNTDNQCSSLVILDAQSMQQVAEAFLPVHLPLGLHGNF